MGEIYKKQFGKLIKCINRSTGKSYDDWRMEYVNKPGLIVIAKSVKKRPGKSFVYIYPYIDNFDDFSIFDDFDVFDNFNQPYLRTSCGDIKISDDGCEITTTRSIYKYAFGDFGLNELTKQELCLNVFGEPSL